ncbi:5'-nucleotidase C-terminal domain-containing protein [Staphylococcus aureus]
MTNGGGIRASIAKGKVTRYDLISVLPLEIRLRKLM